jgi:DnaD/phage-associated family protein
MKPSQAFSGFSESEVQTTSLPGPFFSDLLPSIDDLGELKITLYAFWALEKKEGRFEYLAKTEMLADKLLVSALRKPPLTEEQALDEALERAVARGTFLKAELTFSQGNENFYFLNTEKGRAAIRAIKEGKWAPSGIPDKPLELSTERPNVFNLYEQNIGPLTPMIADTLRDAEATYPESWLEDAIHIAVENNVRKWSYINAILDGWQTRGKDAREDRGDTEKARREYLEGWFDDE